jgi:hypothetical protein
MSARTHAPSAAASLPSLTVPKPLEDIHLQLMTLPQLPCIASLSPLPLGPRSLPAPQDPHCSTRCMICCKRGYRRPHPLFCAHLRSWFRCWQVFQGEVLSPTDSATGQVLVLTSVEISSNAHPVTATALKVLTCLHETQGDEVVTVPAPAVSNGCCNDHPLID